MTVASVAAPEVGEAPSPTAEQPAAVTANARQIARTGTLAQLERLLGLTVTGMGVAVVAAIGWLAAYTFGGKSLYILVYCAVLLVAAAAVIARRGRKVSASRSELPRRMREGQTTEVELTLSAKHRLASFVIEEQLNPLLGNTVRIPIATLRPDLDLTYRYELRPILRGVYKVGPLNAVWTDPLGLARHEQQLLAPDEVLVHPNTELIYDRPLTRMWEDPPIRPPVSKPWPQGFEFYGMRDYVRGDDLRRMVWRAVARTGKFLVRESEQGITDKVVVLIDTDKTWHSPGQPSETFELAVRVAASLGVKHIKDGFAVSLDANDAELARNLRGPRARILYLDELARLNPSSQPLAKAIERRLQDPQRHVHLILITPHLDAQAAARMRLMVERGVSVLVAAIVWEEVDPNSIRRAEEIGAQVVQVRPGTALAGVFAHSLGAGIR
jgi:uncharacterized protein (DUF58 family)